MGSSWQLFFKLSGNFVRDIFAKHFLRKLQASNLLAATLLEITCLTKYMELAFNSKGYLYGVKNYIYIRMLMPMPMLRCRCRDFQMAAANLQENTHAECDFNKVASQLY